MTNVARFLTKALVRFFVAFQLFFRDRVLDEVGYVLFVRKNALQILIPRFGLEGILYLSAGQKDKKLSVTFVFNEEVHFTHSILINRTL